MKTLYPISNPVIEPSGQIVGATWQFHSPPPHEFAAVACPDEDGGYSVFALNYPGVISEGETLEEARENIAEAFLAALESRRKHREEMAFSQRPHLDIPANATRLWIKVDA